MRARHLREAVAVVFAVVSVASTASAQQPPVFRSQVEVVRVDVAVNRDGKPVPGLGPGDFDLRDNNVRQSIRSVLVEQVPLDIILAFDASSSVEGRRLQRLKEAGTSLLRGLREGDRASLMIFSHRVSRLEPLTGDLAAVARRIGDLKGWGMTSLHDGIFTALLQAQTEDRRTVLAVFSDGLDTASWLTPSQVIDAAKRSPAIVYVVAELADDGARSRAGQAPASKSFLTNLVDETGGRAWWVADPDQIRDAFAKVLQDISTRYVLVYQPEGVSGEGWHRLTVKLMRAKGDVAARSGYFRK
jgi:Ca-activated chloride channel family protein